MSGRRCGAEVKQSYGLVQELSGLGQSIGMDATPAGSWGDSPHLLEARSETSSRMSGRGSRRWTRRSGHDRTGRGQRFRRDLRTQQPLVRRGSLPDAARQRPAGPGLHHGRHRPQGVPARLRPRPQRRRLQPHMGRYGRGLLGHRRAVGRQHHPCQGRRRLRLHRRIRWHQARPGVLGRGCHSGGVPAGHHQVRSARHRLRPGRAGVREHGGHQERDRRREDPPAEQPRTVRLRHHRRHR